MNNKTNNLHPITNNSKNPTHWFYYLGLISYILFYINKEVVWNIPQIFGVFSFCFLMMHLGLIFRKYNGIQLFCIGISLFLVIIVGLNSKQFLFFILSFMLIIGAKGIEYKDILKVHMFVGLSIFFISFIGSDLGIIENRVIQLSVYTMDIMNMDSPDRYCYGYGWPTGCGIHLSFLCMSYFLYKDGILRPIEFLLFCIAFYVSFFITQSRQPALIIVLLMLSSLYFIYLNKGKRSPSNYLILSLIVSVPFFAFISMYATISYDRSDIFWIAINAFFSGRLELGQDAIDAYGFKLFGQDVKMYGADVNAIYYNYVDSSYVQAFLIWGIILTLLLIWIVCRINWQAYKSGCFPVIFFSFLVGLSSVSSQYLFQIYFSPLLLALFSDFNRFMKYETRRTQKADSQPYS